MFTFLQRATPAAKVADVLWTDVRDGHTTRGLVSAASDPGTALDEVIYWRGFATDVTIHRVFQHQSVVESALRDSFLQRLRDYAIARGCTPCPVGDWLADSPNWHVPRARPRHGRSGAAP